MSELDVFGAGKVVVALADPLKEFLGALFGESIGENSQILRDKTQFRRWENAIKMADKANKIRLEKGLKMDEIRPVPLKIFVPILEEGSLEEDENLQDKWASLLAAAIGGEIIHPKFPKILSELSPAEANILDLIYPLCVKNTDLRRERRQIIKENIYHDNEGYRKQRMEEIREEVKYLDNNLTLTKISSILSIDKTEIYICAENLVNLGICFYPEETTRREIITHAEINEDGELEIETDEIEINAVDTSSIYLSTLGVRFLDLCQSGAVTG